MGGGWNFIMIIIQHLTLWLSCPSETKIDELFQSRIVLSMLYSMYITDHGGPSSHPDSVYTVGCKILIVVQF